MPYTILVADDDISLLSRIRRALEEQNYVVRVAQSSEEVISHIKVEPIDLLILGDTLSGQGWLTLLTWFRNNNSTSSLPVIMLTANMEESDVHIAWYKGSDSFQSKSEKALPTLTLELLVKIKRIFKSLEEEQLN